MFGHWFVRAARFFCKPLGVGLLCFLVSAWIFWNRDYLAGGSPRTIEQQFKAVLRELGQHDASVAQRLHDIESYEMRLGIIAAARSAGEGGDRRPILAGIVAEYAAGQTPYRVQLASIPFFEARFRDEAALESLMSAHGTVLEAMELSGYAGSRAVYMMHLEHARRNPSLWPLVWDDPLALSIWLETQNLETVRVYHRNREWMADALAVADFTDSEDRNWNMQYAIHRLAEFEDASRLAIQEAELGVLGLAVMLTHGGVVDRCWRVHGIDPAETVAVIYLNKDVMGDREESDQWIVEKASWLSVIRSAHPVVWLAAMESPFSLRLFQDAPTVAASLLEKHGYMDVATLIYQHFSEPETVEAAARSIDRFGDLAMWVFSHYHDEHYSPLIAAHLIDPEVGIRFIPFVVRYGDEAFDRVGRNKAWVDRYFLPDGSPRVDPSAWIQHIPIIGAAHVAKQWMNGYPCEPSELGWAAFDVASGLLAIASFGATAPVTAKAQAAAGAKRATVAAGRAASASRSANSARWAQLVRAAQAGKLRHISAAARIASDVVRVAGTPIWAGVRVVKWAGHKVYAGLKITMQAWTRVEPGIRRVIYRSMLAAAVIIKLTQDTLPNFDKIAEGIGTLAAKLTAGTVAVLSTAIAAAVRETLDQVASRAPIRVAVVWTSVIAFLVMGFSAVIRGFLQRGSPVAARA